MTSQPASLAAGSVSEPTSLRNFWVSFAAVIDKESRWRMRGRRAFVIITVYVALLGLLVFAVQRLFEGSLAMTRFDDPGAEGFVSGWMSAAIGQALFSVIVVVQTLLTLALAPALTSSAIAAEREKQTLELLITTPVSTLGMIVGKLVSSLAYVFLLILASIPLMSIVFAFGGIAPDDVIRAYVLLFAVAIGIGSIGLFLSALIKRTGVATAISYLIVFGLVIGTVVLYAYLLVAGSRDEFDRFGVAQRPSEAILWLNPLVADIDLACTAIPDSYGTTCRIIADITGQEFDPVDPARDTFWPRSAAAFVVLGVGLTLASTQLIAPSRRARRHLPATEDDLFADEMAIAELAPEDQRPTELDPAAAQRADGEARSD